MTRTGGLEVRSREANRSEGAEARARHDSIHASLVPERYHRERGGVRHVNGGRDGEAHDREGAVSVVRVHDQGPQYDRRPVSSSWRHLDLAAWRLEVRSDLRRLDCPTHGAGTEGVRTEGVPFARSGSRFTRDIEDLVKYHLGPSGLPSRATATLRYGRPLLDAPIADRLAGASRPVDISVVRLFRVDIHRSARRHHIADEDIAHPHEHAITWVELGDDPPHYLVVGPDRSGNLLELVVLKVRETELVIHAMALRRSTERELLGGEG